MAEKRTITKKVISKQSVEKVEIKKQDQASDESTTVPTEVAGPIEPGSIKTAKLKRVCFFCQRKTVPSYTDIATLRRYLSDRAKIVPKLKSGLCSKHQRVVTRQIKYARHLSLLPFTPKV